MSEIALNESFQTGEVIHILPTFCIGPQYSGETSSSHRLISAIAKRELPMAPLFYTSFVDIRDVAAAHIHAARIPALPAGYRTRRYIVAIGGNKNEGKGEVYTGASLAQSVAKQYPHLGLTSLQQTASPWIVLYLLSYVDKRITSFMLNEKSQKQCGMNGTLITRPLAEGGLGFAYQYTSLDQTIKACVDSLVEHGVVPSSNSTKK
jgi:nucleoside-diphosphate-sugar epimerase